MKEEIQVFPFTQALKDPCMMSNCTNFNRDHKRGKDMGYNWLSEQLEDAQHLCIVSWYIDMVYCTLKK